MLLAEFSTLKSYVTFILIAEILSLIKQMFQFWLFSELKKKVLYASCLYLQGFGYLIKSVHFYYA